MIDVIICGSKGRMGSMIAALVEKAQDMHLAAGIDIGDSLENAIGDADVIIDFSAGAASAQNARTAAEHGVPIVIGTTGLDGAQEGEIRKASSSIPIVHTPNMSIGVNVMLKLIGDAAEALGRTYDIRIEETHHIHKKDKPSGTAKKMVDVIHSSLGANKTIDVKSFREGEVVGDHVISFGGNGETLLISHHAESREIFARGAIAAARWIVGRPAGMYDMKDVLKLGDL